MKKNIKSKFFKKKTNKLKIIGSKLICELAQTASKKPSQFSENFSPIFIKSGKGCYIKDLENNYLLDTIMGIGPMILGYNHPVTNKAIKDQLKSGIVFSLIHPLEIKLAQLLKENIPNMEMFRFSKTGADSTSAAIRAARNYTQKDKILSCGYHGWHDWNAISLNKNSGIPIFNKKLIKKVKYNNFEEIADNLDNSTAGLIMEPIIFEFPKKDYLQKIRKITKQKKIILIFDEMWTGFRLHIGGAQKYFNIDADLVCYSKAIANGMPISVLAGKRKIMKSLNEKSFFYTTFGGDILSIASAISTINFLKKNNVCEKINSVGNKLIINLNNITRENNFNLLNIVGYGARSLMNIHSEDPFSIKTYIHQEFLKDGILWNGIINLSYSHKQSEINKICTSFNKILKKINKIGVLKIDSHLHGEKIKKLVL